MSTLSTHILDISTGQPAQGIRVVLAREGVRIASGVTDNNGRIGAFGSGPMTVGRYQLTAEIGEWFAASGRETLYLNAQIDFAIREAADDHFHLPFLIAPGGWSTYRGS
ncbi:hydroxyisourate hydrolase [Klebsiella sp. RHBSTW-00484]|uniref:hydroxyisourate hydrolase n=1 Tax=unclassified Klebsiella TaxID=2608929 RepID=UPI0015E4A64E|nr:MULTISPECIES: hydroxyisourate hydrolase [unclassified Klebsiella]MBA7846501.1 hydroxyisourate hydrolase [Klebsiella sp. RHBSTW-00465]QLO37611.1 hydroxyisourate hydrolase [Klebsiella sp. RHBSTW-00484]QLT77129.1 hydroxyisourate hydrolase [Klebsiella sp. RHBSTW-00464]